MGLLATLGKALPRLPRRERAGRAARPPAEAWEQGLGLTSSWAPATYGEYYPRSALVYSAIRVRQDAVVRAPLSVYRRSGARGGGEPAARERAATAVGPDHPAQRLLDRPNPFWTRGELWRATETSLGLWGAAFWGLERRGGEVVEIWPLRSDRMRVVPDDNAYVKGFVYVGAGHTLVPYVAEDVVWIRYFNPLDELAGLSPMAPLRLSVDMGIEALRANRNNLSNDSTPGMIIETMDTPTDFEMKEFYERWEARYQGVDRVRRPALLSSGMRATNLGFSPKGHGVHPEPAMEPGGRLPRVRRSQADAGGHRADNVLELPDGAKGILGRHHAAPAHLLPGGAPAVAVAQLRRPIPAGGVRRFRNRRAQGVRERPRRAAAQIRRQRHHDHQRGAGGDEPRAGELGGRGLVSRQALRDGFQFAQSKVRKRPAEAR